MGKNKLKKFRDMEALDCVLQYPFSALSEQGFPMRGLWHEQYFKNNNPIVLELGCGKGEYTVGLAQLHPDKNFIGIDIKGARMWTGARRAHAHNMTNVAFLRTSIELLPHFFAPGEVAEIWITFPDPQMQKVRRRLTSTRFLDMYRQVLGDSGIVHLKTDSPFLYAYTRALTQASGITPLHDTPNLYASPLANDPALQIRTHYEQQWLDRGLTIKYLAVPLTPDIRLTEPECEPERDTYRSYSRGQVQCPELCEPPVTFHHNDNPALS